MISRRLIRIKVLQTIYSYKLEGVSSVENAQTQLFESLNKLYESFYYLTSFIVEIFDLAKWKISQAKNKLLPSQEDLNPNTKFIDNQIIAQIRENIDYQNIIRKIPYKWNDEGDQELVKKIFNQIKQAQFYQDFMKNKERSYRQDKKIILWIIEELLYKNDDLYDNLEEKSLFWADSIDYSLSIVYGMIAKYSIGDDMRKKLFNKFRNQEDITFSKELLINTLNRQAQYLQILEDHIDNWDISRLAKIDIIILLQAIHEILYFENIPIKVSLDEYIEIAKYMSTHKSPSFVNGILDKIVKKLDKENLIIKN